MVVPACVATPVHDHRAWGLVGVYEGRQREKVYRRVDDGSRPDFADLQQVAENILAPGDITTLLPPELGFHMIETISAEPSISIHVLGNDIGCEHRHRYDVEHKAVHRFKSGYVNTSCTAFRLAHQHLVVDECSRRWPSMSRCSAPPRSRKCRSTGCRWSISVWMAARYGYRAKSSLDYRPMWGLRRRISMLPWMSSR